MEVVSVRKTFLIAILFSAAFAFSQGARCTSYSAAVGGGWKPIASAPRDGRKIEFLETYGVAPWYDQYRWMKKGEKFKTEVNSCDSADKCSTRLMEFIESEGRWVSTSDERKGLIEDECGFWRPTAQTGKYSDPTGGKQNTIKYWCDSMGMKYDAKADRCIAP
jgi:hypothetical protein